MGTDKREGNQLFSDTEGRKKKKKHTREEKEKKKMMMTNQFVSLVANPKMVKVLGNNAAVTV